MNAASPRPGPAFLGVYANSGSKTAGWQSSVCRSAPQQQETLEGQALQAQWFERVRLELHPENARPYDVLLGRLGVDRLTQQGRDWFTFPKTEAQTDCRFFAETGHNVCGAILAAWRASGLEFDGKQGYSEAESLALFGLPLSDAQTETIEGKDYSVQWFERARFELHPENQPPYDVLLGRLGAEVRNGSTRYILPGNAVFPEGVAYQPSAGAYFVGSTTDGTIFRGTLHEPAASVFLPPGGDGRTTATGLKVDSRGRLFVSGGCNRADVCLRRREWRTAGQSQQRPDADLYQRCGGHKRRRRLLHRLDEPDPVQGCRRCERPVYA